MAVPLRDRLSFLSRLPALLKGTADDDAPCPGYLLEEIAKISRESPGSSQCLLEYLLNRLQSNSCHVKLKVLKILLHTCAQGSPQFVLQLKRNATFIREAAVFAGPPDPLHGNSLNQKVRAAAQDLASVLFSDALLPQPATLPARPLPPVGMGSKSSPCSSLQGFGFSSEKSSSRGAPASLQGAPRRCLPARVGTPSQEEGGRVCKTTSSRSSTQHPSESPARAGRRRLGRDGQRAQLPGLLAGERHHCALSFNTVNLECPEAANLCSSWSVLPPRQGSLWPGRVDADSLGDCLREVSLVTALTRGARVFLTRDEVQHFVKECGLLNCEVVLELLSRALEDPSESVRMRSMCAISSLMCSDLLSLDQIFAMTQQHLQQLSQGSPGPVANRATKILRQFEALCRSHPSPKSSQLDTDPPSALAAGSVRCTQDLLADILPLTGESILKPVSVAPLPVATPARVGEQRVEAETCGQSGVAVPACPCEQEASSRLAGIPGDTAGAAVPSRSLSLFAGMELVARPGMVLSQDSPPAEPRTLSRPGDAGASSQTDAECNREPSAFSFLNM
ncbi:AP-4 complex accessory subunit tepsin isoform X2 [Struthio camelus]|uniref:AP-4 complex accessory subunit tepsin isoform X2 n=1 Tax=Struthio camelus TaxID=8801 RepID=UPI00360400C9